MSEAGTGQITSRSRGWRVLARWYLILPAGVLLAAVVIQWFNPFRETPTPKPPHLAATVPVKITGWWSRDVPLGATEFIAEKVQEVLQTDDVLFREYRDGPRQLGVYVAYWGSGRMPARLVASHTPDRCWTENGWQCEAMRFKERLTSRGRELQPAEWRRFASPGGDPTDVLFWHLIEGRAYDYGERFNKIPSPVEWWKDAVQQAVFGSREQYFVRLSSNVPFEQLWNDPGFHEVIDGLVRLGLGVERPDVAASAMPANSVSGNP